MIAICVDDEVLALKGLKKEAEKSPDIEKVYIFSDPEEALKWAENSQFDIAFLDIEMPLMNGLDLAEKLKILNPSCGIVFCTAYVQYSIDAIRKRVVDGYLLKPFEFEDLQKEINNIMEKYHHNSTKLIVKIKKGISVYTKDGKIVAFNRTKIQDLFTVLLKADGTILSTDQLCTELWKEEYNSQTSRTKKEYLWKLMGDMQASFSKVGIEDVVIKANGGYSLNMSMISIISDGKI